MKLAWNIFTEVDSKSSRRLESFALGYALERRFLSPYNFPPTPTFLDSRLPRLSIPITNAAARKSRGKFERWRDEATPRKLVYTRNPRDSCNFGGGRSVVGGNSG